MIRLSGKIFSCERERSMYKMDKLFGRYFLPKTNEYKNLVQNQNFPRRFYRISSFDFSFCSEFLVIICFYRNIHIIVEVNKNKFRLFTACHNLLLELLAAAPLIEFFVLVSVVQCLTLTRMLSSH